MNEKEENIWANLTLPKVLKIDPQTISKDIPSMNADEVSEHMSKLFEQIKDKTGYNVLIEATKLKE